MRTILPIDGIWVKDVDMSQDPVHSASARRRRGPLWVVAALVGVGAVVVVAVTVATEDDIESGNVLVEDDFSEAAEHWSLGSYKGISSEITDGGYRVSLERKNTSKLDAVAFSNGAEYPVVRIDALVDLAGQVGGATVGLTCSASPGDEEDITGLFGQYAATISTGGRVEVVKTINADEEVLGSGRSPSGLKPSGTNELSLVCRYQDEAPAVLTFSVNGKKVIETEDDSPPAEFDGAGFLAETEGAGLVVVFDDFRATLLND